MAERDDARQVEGIGFSQRAQMVSRRRNIYEGSRPAAARIAQPAILDVPGGEAQRGERSAGVAEVRQPIARAIIAAVNANDHRMWSCTHWQAQVAKVIGVAAIGQPLAISWRWNLQDIFACAHACLFAVCNTAIRRLYWISV